jgi:hypothetical protein
MVVTLGGFASNRQLLESVVLHTWVAELPAEYITRTLANSGQVRFEEARRAISANAVSG